MQTIAIPILGITAVEHEHFLVSEPYIELGTRYTGIHHPDLLLRCLSRRTRSPLIPFPSPRLPAP
jgi:hypothetical protein